MTWPVCNVPGCNHRVCAKAAKLVSGVPWDATGRTDRGPKITGGPYPKRTELERETIESLKRLGIEPPLVLQSIDYAEIERRVAAAILKPDGCTCNGGEGAKIEFIFHDEITYEIDSTCAAHAAMTEKR